MDNTTTTKDGPTALGPRRVTMEPEMFNNNSGTSEDSDSENNEKEWQHQLSQPEKINFNKLEWEQQQQQQQPDSFTPKTRRQQQEEDEFGETPDFLRGLVNLPEPPTEPPAAKRQRKQMTMTQYSCHEPHNVPDTPIRHKDTENRAWLGDKMFMTGDTWTSGKKELARYFFKLGKMETERTPKEALCGSVYMLLENTFIGPEQSERFLQERRKLNKNFSDKVKFVSTGNVLEKGRVRLSFLKDCKGTLRDPIKTPELIYEQGLHNGESAGFTCAFRLKRDPDTLPFPKDKKPVAIDLFAGGGGMSYGFENEGFDVRYKVDRDIAAVDTLKMNWDRRLNPNKLFFNEDVKVFLKNCREGKPLYPKPCDVDHVIACPPCQGFSRANRGPGGQNDEKNNSMSHQFVEAIKFFRPLTGTMENVIGMLDNKNRHILLQIITDLLLLYYQIRLCILKASDYGDPQARDRVILIAAKKGVPLPDYPSRTHGVKNLPPILSVKDALGALEEIMPASKGAAVQLPDGNVVYDHTVEGIDLKPEMVELIANMPSKTVRRANAIKHYSFERCLTVREFARLQSFPNDYMLSGNLTQKRSQIGNAVPIRLARSIARTVMQSYR